MIYYFDSVIPKWDIESDVLLNSVLLIEQCYRKVLDSIIKDKGKPTFFESINELCEAISKYKSLIMKQKERYYGFIDFYESVMKYDFNQECIFKGFFGDKTKMNPIIHSFMAAIRKKKEDEWKSVLYDCLKNLSDSFDSKPDFMDYFQRYEKMISEIGTEFEESSYRISKYYEKENNFRVSKRIHTFLNQNVYKINVESELLPSDVHSDDYCILRLKPVVASIGWKWTKYSLQEDPLEKIYRLIENQNSMKEQIKIFQEHPMHCIKCKCKPAAILCSSCQRLLVCQSCSIISCPFCNSNTFIRLIKTCYYS